MKSYICRPLGLSSRVGACHNLRPAPDGTQRLTAVGLPDVVAPAGHSPLLHFSTPEGMRLLSHEGRELYLIRSLHMPLHLGTLPAEPLCAVAMADSVIVSTSAGMVTLSAPSYQVPDAVASLPAVSLRAVSSGLVRVDVAPRTLAGGDYRRLSELTSADARSVSADLRAAYIALCQYAAEKSAMLQPALASYTLLDAEGRELFTSPPLLLGTRQCLTAVTAACSSDGLLAGYTLTADTWQLELSIPTHSRPDVRSVRVTLSPQLHPVDPYTDADTWLRHTVSDTTVAARLHTTVLTPATIREGAARMPRLCRTVSVVAASPATHTIPCPPSAGPRTELSALASVLELPVAEAGRAAALTQAPHSFTAACGAVSADTVMWGNITTLPYAGYPVPVLAASVAASESWQAYVAVDFASGARAVWTGSGSSSAPLAFSPLLCYPSPDAVSLTIGLSTPTRTLRSVFPLTPLPGGRMSAYVADSLAPVALDAAASYVVPAAVAAPASMPDVVIAADAAAPFVPLAVRGGFGHSIVRLIPALGSTSSWDFGRTRMLAFGTGGIYSVALGSSRSSLAAGRIDSRRTASSLAVAEASDGAVYAIVGSDLVSVTARGATTLIPGCGFSALAWNPVFAELWCFRSGDGTTEVISTNLPGRPRHTRSISLSGSVAGPCIAASDGLRALHHEQPVSLPVAWSATFAPADGYPCRPYSFTYHMGGTSVDLRLSVAASSWLAAEPVPTLAGRFTGDIRSPLVLRPLMRSVRAVCLSVEGTAGADFSISKITLK